MLRLENHQDNIEQAQEQVQAHKPDQRKEYVPRREGRGSSLDGRQQAVGNPGLATEFGREPACRVGDKGKGRCDAGASV